MRGFLQFLGTLRLLELTITILFGEALKNLFKVAISEMREWPTILHYLQQHPGRSVFCAICRLNIHRNLDGFNKN